MSIKKKFAYHKPSAAGVEKLTRLREAYSRLDELLDELFPVNNRELALARTHLEDSATWANKAVVMNDPDSTADLNDKTAATAMISKEHVVATITEFVTRVYLGNWRAAFDHYDDDKDGRVNRADVLVLLNDSGVGSKLARGMIAGAIMKATDANHDGEISWDEFQRLFTNPPYS